jgi:hypothetical protein
VASFFGLTAAGLVRPSIADVRADLEAKMRLKFGSGIPLGDKTLIGFFIGIIAERLVALWELLEQIYSAQDPDKATQATLEAICLLTGIFRLAATSSVVMATLCGDPATVVNQGTLVATLSTEILFESISTVVLVLLGSWAPAHVYAVGDRVTNVGHCYQCTAAGLSAGAGGPTSTDPLADIVDNVAHWTYIGIGTAAADTIFAAVNTGATFCAARDLTDLQSSVGGLSSATNLLDATIGREIQTDESLRLFRSAELTAPGKSPPDAIKAVLIELDNVISATVFHNDTDAVDADGIPPHTVEALVRCQTILADTDQAIWDTLWTSVAGGIGTNGDQVGTVVDQSGNNQTLRFRRPTEIPIYATLDVVYDAKKWPADGIAQIQQAIVTWGDGQDTGRDADSSAIAAQAFSIAGVLKVTDCLIGLAPRSDAAGLDPDHATATGNLFHDTHRRQRDPEDTMIRRPKMLCGIIAFLASMALLSQNAGCGSRGAPTHSDAGPPADAHLDASSSDASSADAGVDLMRRHAAFGAVAPQGGTITSVIAGTSLSGGGTSGAVTLSTNLPGGTCGAGSAVTAVSSTGAVTCGTAGVSNAAGVNVIPVSTGAGSGFGSSGETDDGTTWSSSRNAFVTGTFTGSGAAIFKSTEAVSGLLSAGSGVAALSNAFALSSSSASTVPLNFSAAATNTWDVSPATGSNTDPATITVFGRTVTTTPSASQTLNMHLIAGTGGAGGVNLSPNGISYMDPDAWAQSGTILAIGYLGGASTGEVEIHDQGNVHTVAHPELSIVASSTYNTGSAATETAGISAVCGATHGTGSGVLTNTCGYFDATGGDVTNALVTVQGNVIMNRTNGTFTAHKAAQFDSTATFSGQADFNSGSLYNAGFGNAGGAGNVYIVSGTINGQFSSNATDHLDLNWFGYQGGATQFRDLNIRDGEGAIIAAFTGSTKATTLNGSLTTTGAVVNKSTETVWGNWTGSGDVALGDATADHISFNGSAATLLNMNTHTITAVVDPSNPQDAATKHYVDSVAIVGAVAGTTNRMVKFTAANAVGDALGTINLGSAASDTLTVAATTTFNAPVTAAGNLVSTAGTTTIGNLRGQTIAPTLTGGATVGDWAPTGNGTARSVFVNCPSGTCTIDGLVGGADGREITIYNTGAGAIALPNNNSGATAANRWNNATGTEFLVANAGCSADYTYSTADNFWHLTGHICSQWAEDGATATTTRNLQVSGTGTFNSWITAGNSIYGGGGPAAIYLSSGVGGVGLVPGMNCRYSSNAADTCYINAVGYAEGSTQPRSLSIQDGQGSAAAHTLAFFDGANNGVTLGSGAATKITMANQPIGGAGTASGRHWENYEEFMLGGAGYASGTPMGAWEYINSGGAGYLESNVYDITGGGVATGRPGILQLQYSAASPASGYTQISMSSSSAFADGNWSMDGAVAVSALSSSSSASASLYGFWFGFHDTLSATALATNGCYFQYNGAVDTTHLSCVCAAAGVRTTYQIAGVGNSDEAFPLGTATVAATTYMNLLVKMTGTTRAEFLYNGTKVCDINTHIPTAANVTSPRIVLSTAQATGTGARNLFIDWVRVSVDLTSTRSP